MRLKDFIKYVLEKVDGITDRLDSAACQFRDAMKDYKDAEEYRRR